MGMYCACKWKISNSTHIDMINKTITEYEADPDGCTCNWNEWYSIYDWPPERKNKDKELKLPEKSGKYLVRIQTQCGDRYEDESIYSNIPRKVRCGYTGREFDAYWSGDYDEQPYAWRVLDD
jgi:hypothetical protein